MARTAKKGSARGGTPAGQPAESGIQGILDGLEGVVAELESGELPLEKALERFEEGVKLARRGSKLLDEVEERVEVLLADRDETEPLNEGNLDEEA